MSASDSKIIKTELLKDADAKWTKLILTTYTDPTGTTRTWEHAERRSRPADSAIDGVGIVAILEKATGPELMLQKQYRPPINKVTIEVPAGLVDAGESAQDAAVRELKEETGYVGVVSEESPVMFNGSCAKPGPVGACYKMFYNPGFCNTNLKMVHVTIDMDLPENKNPKPQLEENEFIEVFTVKLTDLWAECKKLEGEGYAIDARVGTLAEGIEIAKRWKF